MVRHLIAIDGLDASGKKTQTELLKARFAENGIPFRYLSFPTYDDEYSAQIKMYLSGRFGSDPDTVNPYAASSFFAVDRYCSYMLDWRKDYLAGNIILADRYTSANAVHQLSKLNESEYDAFLAWLTDYEYAKLSIPRPDAVIYLCIPPEMSLSLLEKRCSETGAKKDIHESDREYIVRSYRAALYSAEKLGWIRVDCSRNGEMRQRADIHDEIVGRVKKLIPGISL